MIASEAHHKWKNNEANANRIDKSDVCVYFSPLSFFVWVCRGNISTMVRQIWWPLYTNCVLFFSPNFSPTSWFYWKRSFSFFLFRERERVKENGRGKRKQTLTIHIFHHLIFYCLMLSYHSRDVMPLMCDNKINFRGKIWKIMVHPLSSWIFRIGSQLAYNTIYCTFIRKTHIDRFILN